MTRIHLAIIGSRRYPRLDDVGAYVGRLAPHVAWIVTGGAIGVDTAAEEAARRLGLCVHVIRPDYEMHGKAAPHIRNRRIVDTSDAVVAFWDGESRGTESVINYARRKQKLRAVYDEQGHRI